MIYRFDDFELDVENFRLLEGDKSVHLQPRVLDFLVFLIQNRGRLVTKAELVEAVWEGQAVSDSVFSRCAYELRKALNEDTRQPRYLQTVHGKGFRFLGEVEEKSPKARPMTPQGKPFSRRFRGHRGLVIALFLTFIPLVWWGLTQPSGQKPSPVPESTTVETAIPSVAIAPLGLGRADARLEMIGLSIADLLYHRLIAQDGLTVRPLASSYGVMNRESLEGFAEDLGVQYVISGSLEPFTETHARLELALHDFSAESITSPLGQYDLPLDSAEGNLQDFVQVRDALGSLLARMILPALAPRHQTVVPTPTDPEAYRLYLEGLQKITSVYCEPEVIEILRQSLRLDPRFYPSWELLAVAYFNQYSECGGDGELFLPLAFDSAGEALLLSEGRSQIGLIRSIVYIERGELERAWEEFHHQKRPQTSERLANRIYNLRFAGLLREASKELANLFTLDPLYMKRGVTTEAPMTLLYLGELESFLFHLPRQESSYHLFNLGLGLRRLNRIEESMSALDRGRRKTPGRLFSRYSEVLFLFQDGEYEESLSRLEALVKESQKKKTNTDGEMHFRQAGLFALLDQPERAVEELQFAYAKRFLCHRCVESDPALKAYEGRDDYRVVVGKMYGGHRDFALRFGFTPEKRPDWLPSP